MPVSAIAPRWIRRWPLTNGDTVLELALDVYTKSTIEDRMLGAKQLEESVLNNVTSIRKRVMLNGGLWRVCFWSVSKLLILERETGLEPATSSLGN